MIRFFQPNLTRTGRRVRAWMGLAMVGLGLALCWRVNSWLGAGVIALGGFALYEAARGWCFARACGLKTRF